MNQYSVIFITASNIKEAKKISNVLLKARLVACVNIVRSIDSLFWWQGKIDKAREALLIIKTRKKLFSKICRIVKANHSYQTPEIISFPLYGIDPGYRRWLDASII